MLSPIMKMSVGYTENNRIEKLKRTYGHFTALKRNDNKTKLNMFTPVYGQQNEDNFNTHSKQISKSPQPKTQILNRDLLNEED